MSAFTLDSEIPNSEGSLVPAPVMQFEREHPMHPPTQVALLRKHAGLSRVTLWDGSQAWLAIHYDDVRAVLSDPRFSTVTTRPGYPFVSRQRKEVLTKGRPNFTFMDAPDHTKFRRAVMPLFAVKNVSTLHGFIDRSVDDLIDDMIRKGDTSDFVAPFALELPVRLLAEFTGVPRGDCALFLKAGMDRFDTSSDPGASHASGEELWDYLDRFFAEKERGALDGDDASTKLVREQVIPGHLTRDEAVLIVNQMLIAGFDTTASTLSMGTLALLSNPGEYQKLVRDDAKVKPAVNELLRFATVLQFHASRAATEDVEIGGQMVRAGEGVIALLHGANRDPEKFPEPDKFDIDRPAAHHMAFSYGVHQCIGQTLARLELETALRGLVRRLPGLRLAQPLSEIEFATLGLAYGPHEFRVKW